MENILNTSESDGTRLEKSPAQDKSTLPRGWPVAGLRLLHEEYLEYSDHDEKCCNLVTSFIRRSGISRIISLTGARLSSRNHLENRPKYELGNLFGGMVDEAKGLAKELSAFTFSG